MLELKPIKTKAACKEALKEITALLDAPSGVRTMSSMLDDMSPSWSRCSARLEPPSGRSSNGSARLAEWLPSRRRTVIEAV